MNEFKNFKDRKDYGMSKEEFYERIKDDIINSKQALVITVDEQSSGHLYTGGDTLEMIGALSRSQFIFLNDTTEWVAE